MHVLPEGRLSYGMQLPVQSQSTIYAEPWEAGAGPRTLPRSPGPPTGPASRISRPATMSRSRGGSPVP